MVCQFLLNGFNDIILYLSFTSVSQLPNTMLGRFHISLSCCIWCQPCWAPPGQTSDTPSNLLFIILPVALNTFTHSHLPFSQQLLVLATTSWSLHLGEITIRLKGEQQLLTYKLLFRNASPFSVVYMYQRSCTTISFLKASFSRDTSVCNI